MTYEKGIPDYAMVLAKEIEDNKIVPITKGAIYSHVQITNIAEKPKTTITLEEDILVPDTKPDLKEILMINGKPHLTVRQIDSITKGEDSINLSGEIDLQMLYVPEKAEKSLPVISVQSRVPFKDRWHTSMAPGATVILDCNIEKIDYMVINERKYRVKIVLSIMAKEYSDSKVDIFEGLIDEDLQSLKETIEISSVSMRKKDTLSISENIFPKDNSKPEAIIKQDLTIVENYKQISTDKIVINGFVYVNLLYMSSSKEEISSELPDDSKCSVDNLHQLQDRIEFTQFIPISQSDGKRGCTVNFDDSQLRVKLIQDEEEKDAFRVEGEILTYIELYKNVEKEIIVDGYHRNKDFVCKFEEKVSQSFVGTTSAEASSREIISPENFEIDNIIYAAAEAETANSHCEQGKIITEGNIAVKMICSCSNEERQVFAVNESLPYRVAVTMPQLTGNEIINHKVYIKDIWAEKINNKQLEFNAAVMVFAEVMRPAPFKTLTEPAFEESSLGNRIPPMVIYVCKKNDNLWQIAKRFKTTCDLIKSINELETEELSENQKLLILK